MIEKTTSTIINYFVKQILLFNILLLTGSIVIAQNFVIVESRNWMDKLSSEDQQKFVLADQNLKLASDLLSETDSLEKAFFLLKSSNDSTNLADTKLLNQDIILKKHEAYNNIVQANNIKIQIYTSSIDKEIPKVSGSTEYFEKISKLIKEVNDNLDEAAILKNISASESDTNIYIENLVSIIELDNAVIQKFKEISTIVMIIEEDSVEENDTNMIPNEPMINESDSDALIVNYKSGIVTYGDVTDSSLVDRTEPDSIVPIEKDTVTVNVDTSFSFMDKRFVTVQDSEGNMAIEKNVAVLRNLLDFKKDSHKVAIGSYDTALYVNVIVNEKVVETLKIAIENYEEDSAAFNDIFNITSFDIDLIRNAWENYVEEISPVLESEFDIEGDIEDDDDLSLAIVDENKDNDEIIPVEEPRKTVEKTSVKEQKRKTETSIGQLIFKVQIAAGRTPLDEKKLKSRYSGNREIKMFQEEAWYKYYIADCNSLKEAILIKKEANVPDAFIMAYDDGVKVQFYLKYVKAKKTAKPNETEGDYRKLNNLSKDKTILVVQIVASRAPMKREEIRKIYSGNEQINYIEEEGWHKYSIGNFNKFRDANLLRKTLEIDGAFVVAYSNGEKIDYWARPKKTKSSLNNK